MIADNDILYLLRGNPGLKGRELVVRQGADKSDVNSAFWKLKNRGLATQDNTYLSVAGKLTRKVLVSVELFFKRVRILFVGKNSRKARVTFARTSHLSVQRHRWGDGWRLTVGNLFGQTPKSLVQVDLGINAAQCPHRP